MAENAADLNDIEADVDDQMAREGMAKIVEPHAALFMVEARADRGAT